jgi:threonine dehydrogenase-like Zn-dependent dehydrogenase
MTRGARRDEREVAVARPGRASRAAVLVAPRALRVVERPPPEPGRNEVLIRVSYAGICGTDLALFRGDYHADLPLVLGHEFCGRVVATGGGVSEKWRDAYVAAEINSTCLTRREADPCPLCRRELPNHCANRRVLGIRAADGAFADRVVVPEGALHPLPADLSPWAGVLVEPVAAALRTFELTPVSPGDAVVVLGAGRLGLLVTCVARSYGARVFAVSRAEATRSLARRFGAHDALDAADPDAPAAVRRVTGGVGADVVVECTGRPEGLMHALAYVRPRGAVALKTTCGIAAPGVDVTGLAVREITVQGSRCGPFGKAIERLASGLVPVDDYVSGVYPLEDAAGALEAAGRSTKVLLEIDPP